MTSKFIKKIHSKIYETSRQKHPLYISYPIRFIHILFLSIHNFSKDDCPLRASALTFYSLLSIVPILAMAFGLAKGFGLEFYLENLMVTHLRGQEEILHKSIGFARNLLQNARGGVIAGIGVISLFWSVIKLFRHSEIAFNKIWRIQENRPLGRMLSDYLSLCLVGPFLLIISNSITLILSQGLNEIVAALSFLNNFNQFFWAIIEFLPYLIIWLLFSFLYSFIPNTNVHYSSAIFAGVIAGTLYQVFHWTYLAFQVGITHYGTIYGSFAAFPLFLIWIQMSWNIVLFGAELSFSFQNPKDHPSLDL